MAIPVKSDLDLENSSKILNVPNPVSSLDAANKDYIDTNITELSSDITLRYATKLDINNITTSDIEEHINLYYTDQRVQLNKLNELALPDSDININNNRVTNIANPVNNQDAVTKSYHEQNSISLGLVIALG